MRWKDFSFGLGVGAIIGFIASKTVEINNMLSPEKVLKMTKEKFKQQGPINGSWIYMKPDTLTKEHFTYDVYHGGISRLINGETIQYEFYVDAYTGSIIEIAKRASNV
ncbi:putative small secreted protein [Salirhabdus euzebyi]|uniref:Putative small secreted protein n=1 Tax=Salirhabdus euzebyi TaxID=394506 RepID=A0A841PT47_9BACI|nr:PepSY domain-containing protein [Salirhabdus euzebyi]MBB6452157.1 putative small secreted protein [Salirhabdus euzebyi]